MALLVGVAGSWLLDPIAVAQVAIPPGAENVSPGADAAAEADAAPVLPRGTLRAGDTLKIVFYESLDDEEGNWKSEGASSVSTPRSFYQRTELTGAYPIDADGMISLPLLGRFQAEGLNSKALEAALEQPYENLVGRTGFVNVLAIEHQPIYITGLINSPGSVAFVDSMTVMHAIAMAGGVKIADLEPWQQVEVGRQIERLKTSIAEIKRVTARAEVLEAARDGRPVSSIKVAGLESDAEMQGLLADEAKRRDTVGRSLAVQEASALNAVKSARSDLMMRQARIASFDSIIDNRRKRLENMERLPQNRLSAQADLGRAQNELVEVESQRQQAIIDVENAKQRLAAASYELKKQEFGTQSEVDQAAFEARLGVDTAVRTAEGEMTVFQMMTPKDAASPGQALTYQIIRQGKAGPTVLPASVETLLEPGDLVQVQ